MSSDTASVIVVEDSLPKETMNMLNSMRVRHELCDVVLLANGHEIPAHRVVLAASSPYFRVMFLSGFVEAKEEKIALKDINPCALEVVVNYLYTSETKIDVTNVEDVLAICVLFQLDNLIEHCETFLRRNMTPSNCLGLQSIGGLFSLEGLKQHADRFSLWHFGAVSKEEEFKELPYSQLRLLISDDTLKVKSEEMVFEAVWKWICHDFKNRKGYVADVMQYVRFPLMNLRYLNENGVVMQLTKEYSILRDLVREAICYQTAVGKKVTSDVASFRVKPRMASEDIYVIGGWSNGQKISSVQCFNVDTLQWTVVAGMTVAHVAREDYFRVVVVKDELYTVSRHKVGKYDPISNCWIQIANGPDIQYKWAGVCECDGYIYVVGGHSSMCAKRFDPESLVWESLPLMRYARYYPGVAVLQGMVYAVGGLDHLWAPLNTAERFNSTLNQWEEIAPMNSTRWSLGVAVLDDQLYAIGGSDNKESFSNSVEVYDPTTNVWNQSVAPLNSGRRCLGVAVVNDVIYAVGGRVVNSVEYYDKKANEWRIVGAVNTRCSFGCVALRLL